MPPVRAPLLRIPYTNPLPAPRIIPPGARTASGAVAALVDFLARPLHRESAPALLLTGAGISVASGLADYRGTKGTYTLNKTYRPIYYNEFCENHEMRKRYWARSFLGWTNMRKARPNPGHAAVARLGELGIVRSVITQSTPACPPSIHAHRLADQPRRRQLPPASPPRPPHHRAARLPPHPHLPHLQELVRQEHLPVRPRPLEPAMGCLLARDARHRRSRH